MLNYPVLYASARDGYAMLNMDDEKKSVAPIFDVMIEHIPSPDVVPDGPGKLLVTTLDYNDYVGRIGVGRVIGGCLKKRAWCITSKKMQNLKKIRY